MSGLFGNRKANYVKGDDVSLTREEKIGRLKFELREHIRFLGDHDVLSTEWLRMAESLHQIANVAFMETTLPPSEDNPLNQTGKKDVGTLWDQEKDELAIRILLEEGKLNLALRILHKFKVTSRKPNFEDLVKATSKKFNSDQASVNERCRIFEQSLGVLLKFAVQHVEALQILDIPELLIHVKEVLTDAEKSDKKDLGGGSDSEKFQETVVIQYLYSVSTKMEDLDEDRIMDLIEANGLVPLAVQQLCKHYSWYKVDILCAASKFLSNSMSSEAYMTDPRKFVSSKELEIQCVSLKGFFIAELQTNQSLKKKEVRALMDEISRWEAIHGEARMVPLKSTGVNAEVSVDRKNNGSTSSAAAAGAASRIATKPAAVVTPANKK